MGISLFEHNAAAYRAAMTMLDAEGRAAIVHPTGTGKSFIAFKLCEEHPDCTVCWLSPSSYIFETQIENLKQTAGGFTPKNIVFLTYAKLTLLSEEEITAIQPDYIILDEFHRCGAAEWGRGTQRLLDIYPAVPVLGLSATNVRYLDNQRDMAEELFEGNIASNISLGEAIVRGILPAPRYVISLYSCQKDLERYERRVQRTKTRAVRDAAQKYLDKLRRSLALADGLDKVFARHLKPAGKYIVFCANLEHLDEMIARVPEWFGAIDCAPNIYRAYSEDPMTSRAFQDFKADNSDHLKLLFCIDMLNEGIHVSNVDGVVLFRPTISPIVYKQQIGRALASGVKTTPLILDVVNNFENLYSIDAIEEEMRAAIVYYRALDQDDSIEVEQFDIIDELRDCRKLFDALNDTLQASWDAMYRCAKAFYEANGNLEVPKRYKTPEGYSLGYWLTTQRRVRQGRVPGHLSSERIAKLDAIGMNWQSPAELNWDRYFAAAATYHEKFGDLNIPSNYVSPEGLRLGAWICNLRSWERSGIHSRYLTEERKQKLNELGMIWAKVDYLWERYYFAACEYHRLNGNLEIPDNYVTADGLRLGNWITRLRQQYAHRTVKYGRLTEQQIERMNGIGMIWESRFDHLWSRYYLSAADYYSQHGNLDVPNSYLTPAGMKLGRWIYQQREAARAGKLREDRRRQLDAIGMIWEKIDPWEQRFILAKQYYDEHGSLKGMPGNYAPGGIWINKWLNEQRHIYCGRRKGKTLTPEQINKLESIGFSWSGMNDAAWEENFRAVEAWHQAHSDLALPENYKSSTGILLKKWLRNQSKRYQTGKMPKDQAEKLYSIGALNTAVSSWEEGYRHLCAYWEESGTADVPKEYLCNDGFRLGNWVSAQRTKYRNQAASLTLEQIQKMECLGFTWNRFNHQWMQHYEQARTFSLENGHLFVPRSYKKAIGYDLADWVTKQRSNYRRGKLTQEQIQMLENIGMDWRPAEERY